MPAERTEFDLVKYMELLLERERAIIGAEPFEPDPFAENLNRLDQEWRRLYGHLSGERGSLPDELLSRCGRLLEKRRENMELLQGRLQFLSREMERLEKGRKTAAAYRPEAAEPVFLKDLT